jgi:hypothetical protein
LVVGLVVYYLTKHRADRSSGRLPSTAV